MINASYRIEVRWAGPADPSTRDTLAEYARASLGRVTGASLAAATRTGTAADWGRWGVPAPEASTYTVGTSGFWDFGDTDYAALYYESMIGSVVLAIRNELGRTGGAVAAPNAWTITTQLVSQPTAQNIADAEARANAPSTPIVVDYENVPTGGGSSGSGSRPGSSRTPTTSLPTYSPDPYAPPAPSASSNRTRNVLIGLGVVALGGGLAWYLTQKPTRKPARKR